jgi:hypothetical protein
MRVWIDIDNPPQTRCMLPPRASFRGSRARCAAHRTCVRRHVRHPPERGSEVRTGRLELRQGHPAEAAQACEADAAAHPRSRATIGSGGSRLDWIEIRNRRGAKARDLELRHHRLRVREPFRLPALRVAHRAPQRHRRWSPGAPGIPAQAVDPFRRSEGGHRLRRRRSLRRYTARVRQPRRVDSVCAVSSPGEESHYYRSEAREFAINLLRFLAAEGACVVFSPRDSRQAAYLDEVPAWQEEPIVLREPVPFVALLKGVDAVVSAGGTMLREAAYLGVPAYSIFRGNIGAVDRYLSSIGRLSPLESPADFSRIKFGRERSHSPLRNKSTAADSVMRMIIAARTATATRKGRPVRSDSTIGRHLRG